MYPQDEKPVCSQAAQLPCSCTSARPLDYSSDTTELPPQRNPADFPNRRLVVLENRIGTRVERIGFAWEKGP